MAPPRTGLRLTIRGGRVNLMASSTPLSIPPGKTLIQVFRKLLVNLSLQLVEELYVYTPEIFHSQC
jgi:hypothetical protein